MRSSPTTLYIRIIISKLKLTITQKKAMLQSSTQGGYKPGDGTVEPECLALLARFVCS